MHRWPLGAGKTSAWRGAQPTLFASDSRNGSFQGYAASPFWRDPGVRGEQFEEVKQSVSVSEGAMENSHGPFLMCEPMETGQSLGE